MEAVRFEILRRDDGTSEFEEFLCSLPEKDEAKLVSTIRSVELVGMQEAARQQWVKKLRDGIFELRSQQGSDIQRALYFQKQGNYYVITHGFTKKTDKTPASEIEKAKRLMKQYWQKRSEDQ